MRRRRILAALAVIAGGMAASAPTASAASPFTCLGTGADADNIASGVEVNVAFTGNFPEVVVGRRFTISPSVQYKLSNAYLKGLGLKGLLADGENRLGGMTFWVPVAGANTVEGRQYLRAVVAASSNTRVIWNDATDTVSVQRYTNAGAANGAPMQDLSGTATLTGTNTYWTPTSAAPVEFSVANVGTLGVVKVREQWRKALDTSQAPTDTIWGGGAPDVDTLTSARPYGNVYARLRIGQNGRTSLDCASGIVSIQNSTIAYKEAGNYAPAAGGDAGRYLISGTAGPRFASVAPRTVAKTFSCIDGLGSYVGRELNAYDIRFTAGAVGAYTAGQPYTLRNVQFSVELPAVMLQGLYSNLLNYDELPASGVVDQPLKIWAAVKGANTVEGVKVILIEGRWTATFRDPDGVPGTGDESFPDVDLSYTVPESTWTPTGAGPIAFSIAEPAQIPELTLTGFGHSGDAGAIFPMNPYGSVFVRAETGRYGASIDCLEGTIDFADTTIARSNLGRLSPTIRIPTPVAAGAAPSTGTTPAGSAGRYAIVHQPAAPFAVVPAVQAAPAPVPAAKKPVAAVKSATLKSSKLSVAFTCAAADCAGTVKAATTGRHRINGKLKTLDLTKAVKYTVKADGTATVSINLTKDAKALLKKKKRLGVTITVTPASGTKFTKKLTLKT